MNVEQCEKGHWYDPSVDAVCPQCAAENGTVQRRWVNMENEYGATEAVSGFSGENEFGATEPIPNGMGGFQANMDCRTEPIPGGMVGFGGGMDPTEPVSNGMRGFQGTGTPASGGMPVNNGFDDGGETQAVRMGGYHDQTMPVTPGNVRGFLPVTGWLACISGPDKGHDYRIHNGYNNIGRGENMDICIRGDMQISREKHAVVAYDNEEKIFFFGPADGKNIVRVNNKMVMSPVELHAYDILTVGSSKLIFIPLCGEHFDWDV